MNCNSWKYSSIFIIAEIYFLWKIVISLNRYMVSEKMCSFNSLWHSITCFNFCYFRYITVFWLVLLSSLVTFSSCKSSTMTALKPVTCKLWPVEHLLSLQSPCRIFPSPDSGGKYSFLKKQHFICKDRQKFYKISFLPHKFLRFGKLFATKIRNTSYFFNLKGILVLSCKDLPGYMAENASDMQNMES